MAGRAEARRGGEEDVDAVDAGGDGVAGVVEVAAHVGEQAEAARLGGEEAEVGVGLGRGDRGAELHVVDAERVEGGRDRELLLLREVGERELLALAEGGIDDVELADGVHVVVVLVASGWWTCYVGTKEKGPRRGPCDSE